MKPDWSFNSKTAYLSKLNNSVIQRKAKKRKVKQIDTSGNYGKLNFEKASDSELLKWYNNHSDRVTPLSKFSSRAIGEAKCLELMQAMDELKARASSPKGSNKKATNMKAKAETKKAAKGKKAAGTNGSKAAKPAKEKKASSLDLVIHKLVKDNPRRTGTFGFKTWEKIKPGMSLRALIDAGGRRKDIMWDVNNKSLALKPA